MDVAVGREVHLVLHEYVVVGALQRLRVVALSLQHGGKVPSASFNCSPPLRPPRDTLA